MNMITYLVFDLNLRHDTIAESRAECKGFLKEMSFTSGVKGRGSDR